MLRGIPLHKLPSLLAVEWNAGPPDFVRKHRARGAKGLGLRYEGKALGELEAQCDRSPRALGFIASPWFRYRTVAHPLGWFFAQPDALVLAPNEKLIYIVEIKLRHTPEAYFQLFDKYLPMMECFFGSPWKFAMVEVCQWFDPHTAMPAKVNLQRDFLDSRPNEFSAHRMKLQGNL
jgi:hypothetical protein